jgi:hypothetical protein
VRTKARRVGALVASGAALAVFAAPAEARTFATHFEVFGKAISGHEIEDGFAFREALYNPLNLSNRVGSAKARCVGGEGRKTRCAARIHLDGTIGGFGDLLIKGNIGRRDHTLNVVDGSGDFTGGVTGKVVLEIGRNTTLYEFHLTR